MSRATFFVKMGGEAVPCGVIDLEDGAILAPVEEKRGGKTRVEYLEVGQLTATALGYLNKHRVGGQQTLGDAA